MRRLPPRYAQPWSAAAVDRTAQALAVWAQKAEPPDWDPERLGQYANLIAHLGPEEKARRVAYELERARRAFYWQRMVDLADARGYPPGGRRPGGGASAVSRADAPTR